MSDAIYDDVIRTESERMEMIVAIYESADSVGGYDFKTETNTHQPLQQAGSDCVKNKNYTSATAVVCLVLLCVLLLTAVILLCVHIYTNNTSCTEETHQLLTKITKLTEERDKLLINITKFTEERNQILTNNTNLIQLNKNLIREKNELLKCIDETDGWFYYQSSCYYISSDKKNWTESRRYCTERGADLIIINNIEEHNAVLKKKSGISEFWIGLTDIDEEGTWKWVDGSTLTYWFWCSKEPNGKTRENCVVSYPTGWNDYFCNNALKWICEKKLF